MTIYSIEVRAFGVISGKIEFSKPDAPIRTVFTLLEQECYKDPKDSYKTKWTKRYYKCVAWGEKLRDIIKKYIQTHDRVFIEGKPINTKWTDDKGINHYGSEFVIKKVSHLSRPEKPKSAPQCLNPENIPEYFNTNNEVESVIGDDEYPFYPYGLDNPEGQLDYSEKIGEQS